MAISFQELYGTPKANPSDTELKSWWQGKGGDLSAFDRPDRVAGLRDSYDFDQKLKNAKSAEPAAPAPPPEPKAPEPPPLAALPAPGGGAGGGGGAGVQPQVEMAMAGLNRAAAPETSAGGAGSMFPVEQSAPGPNPQLGQRVYPVAMRALSMLGKVY